MLRFFSKLRHTFLGQGKVLRYLTYAVGEIVLVVIGILIALQVNNWNEARKDRESEIEILKEIHANLLTDLDEFELNIGMLQRQQIACQKLLEIVQEDLPDDRSYGFYIFLSGWFPVFTPMLGGYQLLQNKGLNLVSNDELRRSIPQIYEYAYDAVNSAEFKINEFQSSLYQPALIDYKGITSLTVEDQPDSYTFSASIIESGRFRLMVQFDQFKTDTRLHSLIKDAELKGAEFIRWHENGIEKVRELLVQLEAEFE